MIRPVIILFVFTALFCVLGSCKKTSSTTTDNAAQPVLNTQENMFIGTWIKDSVCLFGTSTPTTSTYVSGMKHIFKRDVYCPYCTTPTNAFKGLEETTPGSFGDFVWSAKKQDTLMFGQSLSLQSPQRIHLLTSSKLVLIYKGYLMDSCVAYFHK